MHSPGPTSRNSATGFAWSGRHFTSRQRRRVALFLSLLFAAAGCREWIVEPVRVSSISMLPSFKPNGTLLINKLTYYFHSPRVGDVVVFHNPLSSETMLKRVVAIAGDDVAIENGVLIRNGKAVKESFIDQTNMSGYFFGPERVAADSVFVLGDNRSNSEDSRRFGAIKNASIEGRVLVAFP